MMDKTVRQDVDDRQMAHDTHAAHANMLGTYLAYAQHHLPGLEKGGWVEEGLVFCSCFLYLTRGYFSLSLTRAGSDLAPPSFPLRKTQK